MKIKLFTFTKKNSHRKISCYNKPLSCYNIKVSNSPKIQPQNNMEKFVNLLIQRLNNIENNYKKMSVKLKKLEKHHFN